MEIIQFIQSFSNPFLDKFFIWVTFLGEDSFFTILFALVFWCIDKEFGYKMGFAFYTNSMMNSVLKSIFRIPRPLGQLGIRTPSQVAVGGFSFPSGHVQSISSYMTSIVDRVKKKWIYAAGILLIFLVALSRLYLGVHVPMDVLGGMVAGVGGVLIANWIFDLLVKPGTLSKMAIIPVILVLGMFFFTTEQYFTSAGAITSILIGYYLDKKIMNYTVCSSLLGKILIFLPGMISLRLVDDLIKPLLENNPVCFFIAGLIPGIWITLIIPLLYKLYTKITDLKTKTVKA